MSGMVLVKGGTYYMGNRSGSSDEKPIHSVVLEDYYIGKYEVTQAQWKSVMGNNPSRFKEDNMPVESVSWKEVQTFISELNKQTGQNYRLPTEAEWEFAARGGNLSKNFKYSGSDYINNVAWYYDNSYNRTHQVGLLKPNELGIYDMTGNVWEWCSDIYSSSYYSKSPTKNPHGTTIGSLHVLRGGSWSYNANNCRISNRGSYNAADGSINGGFRLVKE